MTPPATHKTAQNTTKKKQNQDKKIRLTEQKKHTPTKLRLIDQTAQAMILTGCSIKDTAKKLRLSTRAIHKRMTQYPEIQQQIDYYNAKTVELARSKLQGSSLSASEKIVRLMHQSNNERLQLDSATQILDRAGITKPDTNIQVNVLNNLRKDKDQYDL